MNAEEMDLLEKLRASKTGLWLRGDDMKVAERLDRMSLVKVKPYFDRSNLVTAK